MVKNFARRQIPTAIFVETTLFVKLFGHNNRLKQLNIHLMDSYDKNAKTHGGYKMLS